MIGKIYKIIHSQSNVIYVGSTFNELRKRFYEHCLKASNACIYKHIIKYGKDNFKIILIKEYEVVDRTHLEAYEQLWINKLKSINSNNTMHFKTLYSKDYYNKNKESWVVRKEKNKEHIQKYNQKYLETWRAENKDKIHEYRQRRYICECGHDVQLIKKSRHLKSIKHLKFRHDLEVIR